MSPCIEKVRSKLRKNKDHRGQGIVEFALVIPIFLLVVYGVVEVGRLLFIFSAVTTATREAARYGSAVGNNVSGVPYYRDCSGIISAAQKMGSLAGIQPGNISIQYDKGPGTAIFASCGSGVEVSLGDRIVVQATANFQPLAALVNFPPFPVSSESARTIIKGVQIYGTPPDTPTPGPTPTPSYTPTVTPTATDVSTPTATPECSLPGQDDGSIPEGFVSAIDPPDGATGVLVSRNTITVFYNQPMKFSDGGGSVDDKGKYELKRDSDGHGIDILSAVYNELYYSVTLTFDNTDSDWDYGELYYLKIKKDLKNDCDDKQDFEIFSYFKTEEATPTPTPVCTLPGQDDGKIPEGFVSAIDPSDGETGVSISRSTITIFFNQEMMYSAGGGSVDDRGKYELKRDSDGHGIEIQSAVYNPGSKSVTLTFDNADSDWVYGELYYVKIKKDLKNACDDKQDFEIFSWFRVETEPTPTPTQTSTPTATPTTTVTPGPSPTADCSPFNLSSIFFGETSMSLTLYNNHPTDSYELTGLYVAWGENGNFTQAYFGGQEIWSGVDLPPNATITSFSGSTTLGPGLKTIQLLFSDVIDETKSTVIVTLNNGCSLSK